MKKTGYPEINLNVVVVSREKFQWKKQKTSEKKHLFFQVNPNNVGLDLFYTKRKHGKINKTLSNNVNGEGIFFD